MENTFFEKKKYHIDKKFEKINRIENTRKTTH